MMEVILIQFNNMGYRLQMEWYKIIMRTLYNHLQYNFVYISFDKVNIQMTSFT